MYVATCLAGLAAGLWPDAIHRSQSLHVAPLPTLRALVVAQVVFMLIVHPLVLLRRTGAGERLSQSSWEFSAWLLVTIPFYIVAAWLADAVVADVMRAVIVVIAVSVFAWGGGVVMARLKAFCPAAMLALLLTAIGMPAVYYILRDFVGVPAMRLRWLWDLAPVTLAWDAAAARSGSWYLLPVWPWVFWLLAGGAMMVAGYMFARKEPARG